MAIVESHGNGPDNDAKKRLPSKNVGVVLLDEADDLTREEHKVDEGEGVEDAVTLRSDEWIWSAPLG